MDDNSDRTAALRSVFFLGALKSQIALAGPFVNYFYGMSKIFLDRVTEPSYKKRTRGRLRQPKIFPGSVPIDSLYSGQRRPELPPHAHSRNIPFHETRLYRIKVSARKKRSASLLLFLLLAAMPAPAQGTECSATGSSELTQAEVHEARMEAKSGSAAFDFSSGSLTAAKACAALINRISSLSIGSYSIPSIDEVLEAVKALAAAAVTDAEEEACKYVASTSTSWVRSQASTVRTAANSQASSLLGTSVSVTNIRPASILRTYRNRLKGSLPGYSDLPSLK